MISEQRVPALDGVRGIAILAVFVYHTTEMSSNPRWGSWGWMGVDLFFVLSGYLITGILLDTHKRADYYRTFYIKRALRILPAFVVFVLAVTFLAPMKPNEHQLFVHDQGWIWGYAANVLVSQHGWAALPFGTGPLWSLAVEEQFYLVWPFAIAHCTPRSALHVALSIIIGVAVLRAVAVFSGVSALSVYVLPIFRADTLAWGALLASIERQGITIERLRIILLFVGGVALAAVLVRLRNANNPSPSMQVIGYPALAILCAGLVVSRDRWLEWKPLRLMGRFSYGFYLWHSSVLLAISLIIPPTRWPMFALCGFACTLCICLASWIIVERPALKLKSLATRRARFVSN